MRCSPRSDACRRQALGLEAAPLQSGRAFRSGEGQVVRHADAGRRSRRSACRTPACRDGLSFIDVTGSCLLDVLRDVVSLRSTRRSESTGSASRRRRVYSEHGRGHDRQHPTARRCPRSRKRRRSPRWRTFSPPSGASSPTDQHVGHGSHLRHARQGFPMTVPEVSGPGAAEQARARRRRCPDSTTIDLRRLAPIRPRDLPALDDLDALVPPPAPVATAAARKARRRRVTSVARPCLPTSGPADDGLRPSSASDDRAYRPSPIREPLDFVVGRSRP